MKMLGKGILVLLAAALGVGLYMTLERDPKGTTVSFGKETTAREETVGSADKETTVPEGVPHFTGLNDMEVAVNGSPDYGQGVRALDAEGNDIPFTWDDSGVDLSVQGTYQVVYTAGDLTEIREVAVDHTQEETESVVAWLAGECGDDPLSIKCYIRDNINYSSNYGAGDPVWYGISHGIGNCYVHARVLQEVLEYKGYEVQLIWVKDKSHYWVLVNMGDCWRHLDATPGAAHGWTELMTDEERAASLDGRDWDHDNWPAASGR